MRYRLLVAALVLAGAIVPARAGIGDPAALAGRTVEGAPFDLAAERGHVVIVDFWATWCQPCRKEMPMLSDFARDHAKQDVVVIGVSEDVSDNTAKVLAAMKDLAYPSLMIGSLIANSFGHQHVLPVTFVIDGNGVVRAKLRPDEAPVTAGNLQAAIAPYLGK